jgi:nucleotide-binding universal stress UspA family protein
MKLFKKILCPVDFSEASEQAFEYAKAFAASFNSELVLLHVSPNISEAYTALMPDFPTYGLPKQEDLLVQFDDFSQDWSGKLDKIIRIGTPYLEILDFADEAEIDLIVLGAKGLSKFERLFLGSTGEKVARKSKCPVMTVHAEPRKLPIKRILVPVDFSPLSYEALPVVATIAETFQAEINLLHVVEIGHGLDKKAQEQEYEYFERVRQKLAEEWELPEEFKKLETKKFVRHHIGSAGYGILEFAQDWDVDLIAMTTHGRTGLKKAFMGSVTEKVIKIAPFPVLSIKSKLEGK